MTPIDNSGRGGPRVKRPFRIEELRDGHVWATLLESEKRGLQFALKYGGFRDELSEDEMIVATVESLNDRNTAWAIRELHSESNHAG